MKTTEPKKPRDFYAKAVTRKSGAGTHEVKKHVRKEKHPVKSFKQFHEEGPVAGNAVSSGNVQGIGFGPKGEPGGTKSIMGKMLKRKPLNVAAKLPS
jgi:hypothetical protein